MRPGDQPKRIYYTFIYLFYQPPQSRGQLLHNMLPLYNKQLRQQIKVQKKAKRALHDAIIDGSLAHAHKIQQTVKVAS